MLLKLRLCVAYKEQKKSKYLFICQTVCWIFRLLIYIDGTVDMAESSSKFEKSFFICNVCAEFFISVFLFRVKNSFLFFVYCHVFAQWATVIVEHAVSRNDVLPNWKNKRKINYKKSTENIGTNFILFHILQVLHKLVMMKHSQNIIKTFTNRYYVAETIIVAA